MLEVIAILSVGSLFAYMGLRALRTGVAAIKGYRFQREESYMLFWGVTAMWFSMSFLVFLPFIAGVIHYLLGLEE
ncbi:hypothetical protein [Brevifollis gellanilyticus]|uniref:Uncharacterized protein n=1 Tax=Brevifollis gellanilyticus TaxID=748831 RepID=A0A512M695_9BACT|nr:hypothetical protein [Brevifollis gellanilyticus]GEP42250.1 hypothetical protein BGE01nite_15410 [Brevifollis gellanilyticus]